MPDYFDKLSEQQQGRLKRWVCFHFVMILLLIGLCHPYMITDNMRYHAGLSANSVQSIRNVTDQSTELQCAKESFNTSYHIQNITHADSLARMHFRAIIQLFMLYLVILAVFCFGYGNLPERNALGRIVTGFIHKKDGKKQI